MKKISQVFGLLLILFVMGGKVYSDEIDKPEFKCFTNSNGGSGIAILIYDSLIWFSQGSILYRIPGTECNAVGSEPYMIGSLLTVDTVDRSSWKDVRKKIFNKVIIKEVDVKALGGWLESQVNTQVKKTAFNKIDINKFEIFYVLKEDISSSIEINFMDFMADIFSKHKNLSFYSSVISRGSKDFIGSNFADINIPTGNIKWVNPQKDVIPLQGFEIIIVPNSFWATTSLDKYPDIQKRENAEPSMIGINNNDLVVYYEVK